LWNAFGVCEHPRRDSEATEETSHEVAAAPESYPCPDCGQLTDSLKRYHFVKWFVIFLAVAIWKADVAIEIGHARLHEVVAPCHDSPAADLDHEHRVRHRPADVRGPHERHDLRRRDYSSIRTPENFLVRTDGQGQLWLLVGTDSGFEGPTALYYQRIDATLIPVINA
jgi:hypothetical protein